MLYKKKKKKKNQNQLCVLLVNVTLLVNVNYMVIFNILYLELNHLKGSIFKLQCFFFWVEGVGGTMKQRELTVVLCIIWAVTLLYGEMFAYWVPSLWACSWPHHHLNSKSTVLVQLLLLSLFFLSFFLSFFLCVVL